MSYLSNLVYTNQNATRNQSLTSTLEQRIKQAVGAVFGPGATAKVYSGGQPSSGPNRVGTHAHDHGNAGDLYIFDASGKQVTGEGLGRLAQYWQAQKWGGTGMEMKGGGIHLDTGASRSWGYANQGGSYSQAQQQMVAQGKQGIFPTLFSGGASSASMNAAPIPAMRTYNNDVIVGGELVGGFTPPSAGQPLRIGVFGNGGLAGGDNLTVPAGAGAEQTKVEVGETVAPSIAGGVEGGLVGFGNWALGALTGPLFRILFVILGLLFLVAGLFIISREKLDVSQIAVAAAKAA